MAKTNFKSVTEYIASQPKEARGVLRRVVIYFAGWKHHYSIYPATKRLVAAFKDELTPYEVNNKGTIRFPLTASVPIRLLGAIARFRAKEVAQTAR